MRNKLIAAGVGLFSYGALLGWAITGDRMEQKMKSNQRLLGDLLDRKDRELSAARALLLNDPRIQEEVEEPQEAVIQAPIEAHTAVGTDEVGADVGQEDEHGRREEFRNDEPEIPPGQTPEETRTNLQRIIDTYAGEEVHDFESRVLAHEKVEETPPFVISREQYSWDEEGQDYEKMTLTFYPRSQTLLDEEGEILEDPNLYVGWRNLSQFGGESGDADVVFVRNRRTRADYEVVRDTENLPPAHVQHGLDQETFESRKAAGLIRRKED